MIERVEELNKTAEELENKNPKEALELAKKAYKIASSKNYETEKALSLIRIGRCLWLMGSYHKAIKNLNKALEISKTLKSGVYEVEALKALGNVQLYLNIYDNAINFYAKALKIVKRDNLINLEASLLNNIGGAYIELEELDEGLKYLIDSLNKSKYTKDRLGEIISTFNLGEVYLKKKDFNKSREYALKSLQFSKEDNDKIGYRHSVYLLGLIEKEKNNNIKALEFFNHSFKIACETSDNNGQIEILIETSEILIKEGKLEAGIEKLHKALSISKNIDGNTFEPQIYSKLAEAYEQMNNKEKTMEYYKRFHDATNNADAIRREEKLRSISFQLELEQSQQETETYRGLMKELEKRTEELSHSYSQMKVISEIGQSITATLDLRKSFNRIYQNINKLMKSTVLGVGLYNKDEECIEYQLIKENGKDSPTSKIPLTSNTSWTVWAFKNKKEILINDIDKEYSKYLHGTRSSIGNKMSSVIFYPLIVEGTTIGVATVQSKEKKAYGSNDLDTMRIFASYIAIAINNAQKSERLAEEIKIKEKAQNDLEKLNKKLLSLSNLDGLTNIPNRRYFNETFKNEWDEAIKNKTPISILLIDIDKFKEYNDNYGHLEGDIVLQKIAKRIENITKKYSGIAARYGGDEFVSLLTNKDAQQTLEISKRINEGIRELAIAHEYSSIRDIITLSIGCSTVIPKKVIEKANLLNKADEALYLSKERGRDREEILTL